MLTRLICTGIFILAFSVCASVIADVYLLPVKVSGDVFEELHRLSGRGENYGGGEVNYISTYGGEWIEIPANKGYIFDYRTMLLLHKTSLYHRILSVDFLSGEPCFTIQTHSFTYSYTEQVLLAILLALFIVCGYQWISKRKTDEALYAVLLGLTAMFFYLYIAN